MFFENCFLSYSRSRTAIRANGGVYPKTLDQPFPSPEVAQRYVRLEEFIPQPYVNHRCKMLKTKRILSKRFEENGQVIVHKIILCPFFSNFQPLELIQQSKNAVKIGLTWSWKILFVESILFFRFCIKHFVTEIQRDL